MGYKLAIDFGTTNSVVACWNEATGAVELVTLPQLSRRPTETPAALVPSLVYVRDGQTSDVTVAQAVLDQALDQQPGHRLFRNFKRGLIASPAPEPRLIDGTLWADRDAGRSFLRALVHALPYAPGDIEQLVLTAPVASFERYLDWLSGTVEGIAPERIRIVDESTAAALGYAVTEPDAAVLVLDFGGGTLDLSLVQLPQSREQTGGFLDRLRRSARGPGTARVVAKAGRVIGGSDIDHWLLADLLKRINLSPADLGGDYAASLTACERAKIALSTLDAVDLSFAAAGQSHAFHVTRTELEAILETNGFFVALRHVVDKVMQVAQRRGIFREDISGVLVVGGVSLMPSVQAALGSYFSGVPVYAGKPFTAIAEGALQVALGYGLADYLAHSYGLRHLDPNTGTHQYDELIPEGSAYPTPKPVEVILGAAHERQTEVEFVIGEIGAEDVSLVEVKYEEGQAVFVAHADRDTQVVVPLNLPEADQALARLDPPGRPGEDRLKADFRVDDRRRLRVTVTDLKTKAELLHDVVVATLR